MNKSPQKPKLRVSLKHAGTSLDSVLLFMTKAF